MYEVLIAHLRECAKLDASNSTYAEAANAIEELQTAEKKYLANISALETENQHLKRERYWIPVTERLPDAGRYLALTPSFINGGEPVARILRFSKNLESVDRYDFEGIKRSGWYYYDDEYGNIEVDTVTHWMPLPTPPTEEEGE